MTSKVSFEVMQNAKAERNLPDGAYNAILTASTLKQGKDGKPNYHTFTLQIVGIENESGMRVKYPRSIFQDFHGKLSAILLSYFPDFEGRPMKDLVLHWAETGCPIMVELTETDPNLPSDVSLRFNKEIAVTFE